MVARLHTAAVRAAGGQVAAVLGSSPTATERAVQTLGAGRAASSVAELCTAEDIDLVHVCTPNDTHLAITEQILAAGRPVICEKPLATSVPDAQRLTELAQAASLVACVPFVYRFYGSVREARELISEQVDPLWLLHGSYLQDWLAAPGSDNWRVDPSRGGASRAFGDIGVHWCDLMEFVTGHRIVRLSARTAQAYGQRGAQPQPVSTEDGAVVSFETDQGALGSLVISQASPGRKNRLSFSFDSATASYGFDQEHPDSLWVGGLAENRSLPRGASATGHRLRRALDPPPGHPMGYQDAFNAFVADVYSACEGDKPVGLPTFADGLRAAELTEAVLRSARSRGWVEVDA